MRFYQFFSSHSLLICCISWSNLNLNPFKSEIFCDDTNTSSSLHSIRGEQDQWIFPYLDLWFLHSAALLTQHYALVAPGGTAAGTIGRTVEQQEQEVSLWWVPLKDSFTFPPITPVLLPVRQSHPPSSLWPHQETLVFHYPPLCNLNMYINMSTETNLTCLWTGWPPPRPPLRPRGRGGGAGRLPCGDIKKIWFDVFTAFLFHSSISAQQLTMFTVIQCC